MAHGPPPPPASSVSPVVFSSSLFVWITSNNPARPHQAAGCGAQPSTLLVDEEPDVRPQQALSW
jgi:hypothetical protein